MLGIPLSSKKKATVGSLFRATFWAPLRQGSWITAERIRLYCLVILIASALEIPVLFFLNSGASFGADFVVTWAADHAAVNGADFYDEKLTLATDQAATGFPEFFPFPYPPTYALITAPLGSLPFHIALAIWMLAGLGCFTGAMLLLTGGRGALPILAFPAVAINIINGQNGLAFAALFAGALGFLKSRPIIAGVFFGLISTKPHLGVLIPFALAGAKEWRTFGAAAVTVAVLVLASLIVFGTAPWLEFFALGDIYRTQLLVAQSPILAKIVTVFATAQRFGLTAVIAYGVQGVVLVGSAAFIFIVWRSRTSDRIKQATLAFAAIIATPYLFDYDLAILGIGIATISIAGLEGGFLPWEMLILVGIWFVPGVARPVAMLWNFPLVPLVILLELALLFVRIWRASVEARVQTKPTYNEVPLG